MLTALSLFSQEENVVEHALFYRSRRMIFFFETLDAKLSEHDRFLLYSSALAAAGGANEDVILLESPLDTVPAGLEEKHTAARTIDADSWLYIRVSGGLKDIRIQAETYDILKKEIIGARTIEPPFGIDERALVRGIWDELTAVIHEEYHKVVDKTEILFEGVPGTRIRGLPEVKPVIGESGTISVSLPSPGSYSYTAVLPGYYPEAGTFYLGIEGEKIDLAQMRSPKFSLDIFLSNFQFPGVFFAYFPIPGRLSVGGGIVTQAAALYLVDDSVPLIDSNPISILTAGLHLYFDTPIERFRGYGGIGGFIRILHSNTVFGLESTAPGGADFSLGFEFRLSRNIRIFGQYNPAYYYSPYPEQFISLAFPDRYYDGGSVPGFVFFTRGGIDFLRFSGGIKFLW